MYVCVCVFKRWQGEWLKCEQSVSEKARHGAHVESCFRVSYMREREES